MNRAQLLVDAEDSDRAFAILTNKGIEPTFDSRGAGGDVILVPENKAEIARRLIDGDNG